MLPCNMRLCMCLGRAELQAAASADDVPPVTPMPIHMHMQAARTLSVCRVLVVPRPAWEALAKEHMQVGTGIMFFNSQLNPPQGPIFH